jgi:hypothetical protein
LGESASARTERELAELRSAIDRDVDAILGRVREDVDPRSLLRRQPLAVIGSAASVAVATAVGIVTKARAKKRAQIELDVLVERVGGRLGKLKGKSRDRFRKELQKELAQIERTGPKEVLWGAAAAALTAMATTFAQGFGQRLLRDERNRERDEDEYTEQRLRR